jgi:DNA polymerase-1
MEPKAPHALCGECPLKDRQFVPTYAPDGAEVAVIGEGPGYNEAQQGVPFIGQSGKLLSVVIEREGIEYDKTWRSNVVNCWPPNNREPTLKEIRCCEPRLLAELEAFKGNTIIPVGKTAGDFILEKAGHDGNMKISQRRGHWFAWNRRWIMPTWHPAYVLRRPGAAKEFMLDIKRAINGTSDHWLQRQPYTVWVDTVEFLQGVLEALVPEDAVVAFDLETDQVMWYDRPDEPADAILMLGLCWSPMTGYIVHPDLLYDSVEARALLNDFFAREDITFVAHNGKFDVTFLRTIGIDARTDFDTMLAHYALWEITGTHGLKSLALEYYGLPDYEAALVQKYLRSRNDRYSKAPYRSLGIYCTWDVAVTRQLMFDMTEEMEREEVYDWPFKNLLMPFQAALTQVEWEGVKIDRKHLVMWQKRLYEYLNQLEADMAKIADDPSFNPRSPQQVAHVMYNVQGLPRPRVRGVKPTSTAKKAIAHIKPGDNEFVDILRQYRRGHKMDRSYLKNLLKFADVRDRVHPSALIHGTEVGRLSFRNPAIQTIPRPYEDMYGAMVRSAFVAPGGWKFILADYSQAELRVAAVLSEEPFLLEVYREGRDLHTEVAVAMFGRDWTKEERVQTKMFNFSYLYGGSEYSFAEDAGLPIGIARKFVRDYNEVMPKLTEWKRNQLALAKSQGYVVSPFGRKRRFPLITKQNIDDVRKASAHAPVAGAASDLTQLSLIEAQSVGIIVVLTVHDSIGAIAPASEAERVAQELVVIMETTADKYFPQIPWKVDVDIRDRWCPIPEEIHGDQVRQTFG